MGIQRLKPVSSTPVYRNLKAVHNAQVTSGVWKTILNVQGSGYLSKVVTGFNNNPIGQLKITVDGTVIYNGRTSGQAAYTTIGVVLEEYMFGNLNTAYVVMNYGASRLLLNPYGQIGSAVIQDSSVMLPEPIRFKSSVLVEVLSDQTQTNHTDISGGIV